MPALSSFQLHVLLATRILHHPNIYRQRPNKWFIESHSTCKYALLSIIVLHIEESAIWSVFSIKSQVNISIC
jgi:predicted permease